MLYYSTKLLYHSTKCKIETRPSLVNILKVKATERVRNIERIFEAGISLKHPASLQTTKTCWIFKPRRSASRVWLTRTSSAQVEAELACACHPRAGRSPGSRTLRESTFESACDSMKSALVANKNCRSLMK
jgi:hypothetical protein